MRRIICIITLFLFAKTILGQKKSTIKIKKETIDVCGEWEWSGAREGKETSLDSFKLAMTEINDNSVIIYRKSGQFLNMQNGDTAYYGTYKVDELNHVLNWNSKKVNERNYKILYFDNKNMLLFWKFNEISVTYCFRRIKNCN